MFTNTDERVPVEVNLRKLHKVAAHTQMYLHTLTHKHTDNCIFQTSKRHDVSEFSVYCKSFDSFCATCGFKLFNVHSIKLSFYHPPLKRKPKQWKSDSLWKIHQMSECFLSYNVQSLKASSVHHCCVKTSHSFIHVLIYSVSVFSFDPCRSD